MRPAFPELPPAAVALSLRIWSRLHGFVSLEVYGHLQSLIPRPEKLLQDELAQLVAAMGIEQ